MKTIFHLFFVHYIVFGYARIEENPIFALRSSNPAFVRDRLRGQIFKPEMPTNWLERNRKPFSEDWMYYCDPVICAGGYRPVCGLNRRRMRFKWFPSICHLMLNNMCANYRGNIKFDRISRRHCNAFVLFLRIGCPSNCEDDELEPICAQSSSDGHVVIFKNKCSMDMANCRNSTLQEYDEVYMDICEYKLLSEIDMVYE